MTIYFIFVTQSNSVSGVYDIFSINAAIVTLWFALTIFVVEFCGHKDSRKTMYIRTNCVSILKVQLAAGPNHPA